MLNTEIGRANPKVRFLARLTALEMLHPTVFQSVALQRDNEKA